MSRSGRKFGHGADLLVWKGKARIQCLCGKQSPIFKDREVVACKTCGATDTPVQDHDFCTCGGEFEQVVETKEEQAHDWFVYEHTKLIEVRKEHSDA